MSNTASIWIVFEYGDYVNKAPFLLSFFGIAGALTLAVEVVFHG